jgi:hypothetical protein
MAITDNSKLDFLWKKIIFGTTKTDSSTAKLGNNESIPSPLPVYANLIWAQTGQEEIPTIPPASSTSVVEILKAETATEALPDNTAGEFGKRPTWFTGLSDWIPPTFGAQYAVKVYIGNPTESGKQIFPSTTNTEWVFDYNAGVLHFPNNIPSELMSSSGNTGGTVYIEGYRYIGLKGAGTGTGSGEGSLVTRNTWQYTTPEIPVDGFLEFEIELGLSIIVYDLTVSAPCLIQVYGTPERDEDNPYTFRGVEEHLRDDGTTELEDGTIIKTRQYSIFANLEEDPLPKVYARITNETDSEQVFTISMTYFAAVVDVSGRLPKDVEVVNSAPANGVDGKIIYTRDKEGVFIWIDGGWKKISTVTNSSYKSGLFHGQTTDANVKYLGLDGSNDDILHCPNNSVTTLTFNISAFCSTTGESYSEFTTISVKRFNSVTSITNISKFPTASLPWIIAFESDEVVGGIKVSVKGEFGKTIQWAASFTGSCTS